MISFVSQYTDSRLMIRIFILMLSLLVVSGAHAQNITDKDVNAMLHRLDKELANRDCYLKQRQNLIDSLHGLVDGREIPAEERLGAILQLGDAYNAFNTDSDLIY